jgi:hypothetical protein
MSIAETVPDVLRQCAAGFVPAGVPMELAIQSTAAGDDDPDSHRIGTCVRCRDSVKQLDYLAGLPEPAWRCYGGEWEEQRAQTLAAIRRSIAWSTICG